MPGIFTPRPGYQPEEGPKQSAPTPAAPPWVKPSVAPKAWATIDQEYITFMDDLRKRQAETAWAEERFKRDNSDEFKAAGLDPINMFFERTYGRSFKSVQAQAQVIREREANDAKWDRRIDTAVQAVTSPVQGLQSVAQPMPFKQDELIQLAIKAGLFK